MVTALAVRPPRCDEEEGDDYEDCDHRGTVVSGRCTECGKKVERP